MTPVPICSTPPVERSRGAPVGERIAAFAIVFAVVGFVALVVPAMQAYPGGTVWDSTTRGDDFWLNYLSDLQRGVALNGEPNARGATFAQAAMLVLAVGLGPVWWLVARLLRGQPALGRAVRITGVVGVLGALAVGVMPSDSCEGGHAVAIILGGVPGLVAAGLGTFGLAGRGGAEDVAAATGAAAVVVSLVDFSFYVERLVHGGPDLAAVAVLERVAILFVLVWMCAVAWTGARAPMKRVPVTTSSGRDAPDSPSAAGRRSAAAAPSRRSRVRPTR
jgi:hypothetical protein